MIAVLSAMVTAGAVSVNSHLSASQALIEAEKTTLEGVARYRAQVLETIAANLAVDLGLIADSPTVRIAFTEIQAATPGPKAGRRPSTGTMSSAGSPPARSCRSIRARTTRRATARRTANGIR